MVVRFETLISKQVWAELYFEIGHRMAPRMGRKHALSLAEFGRPRKERAGELL